MLKRTASVPIAALCACVALVGALRALAGLPAGLTGSYYSTVDWTSSPVHTVRDTKLSTDAVRSAWDGQPPDNFSVTWSGSLTVLRDATYTLATASDDGSWVYVDGNLVVDNEGRHPTQLVAGSLHLTRGVHGIIVKYFQAGGPLNFELLWSEGGAALQPVPGSVLTPGRPSLVRFLLHVVLKVLFTAVLWLLAVVVVAASLVALWRFVAELLDASPSSPARTTRLMGITALLGATIAVYVFVATAGLFPRWPRSETQFYSRQADSFLARQLPLQADPSHEFWDASYYKKKYFSYFGPVPAVLVAIGKLMVGAEEPIPDNRVALAFSIGLLLGKLLLLLLIGARLFPDLWKRWAIPVAFSVLAFAAPQLYLLARPAIYEAAIIAGQCFLLAGICAALVGLSEDISARRRTSACLSAGVFWALALGSRASVAPAVVMLVLATAIAYGFSAARPGLPETMRNSIVPLGVIAMPSVLVLLALGWLNHVRFDSWIEFGTSYQMTDLRPSWKRAFILPNLYSYLFRSPQFSCSFPFFTQSDLAANAFPQGFRIPSGYVISEPVLGLIWVTPWFALSVVALIRLCTRVAGFDSSRLTEPGGVAVDWLTFCSLILATAAGVVMLGMPLATMRYVGDVVTGLDVLSILGFLWALRWISRQSGIAYRAGVALLAMLAAYTVVAGLLLGVEGPYGQFQSNNPTFYKALRTSLSVPGCGQ